MKLCFACSFLAAGTCSSRCLDLLPVRLHRRQKPHRALEAVCDLRVGDLGIDQLEYVKLPIDVHPRTSTTRSLHTPPFLLRRALRWSRPITLSSLSWYLFALASLFALTSSCDARAADSPCFDVANHAAAVAVEPPATSSMTDVAMRGLRRLVWLVAQLTVRTRHGAPLRCVQLFGSAAAHAPAFVLRLSAVPECVSCFSFDRVCVNVSPPALLRGTAVPNLHYIGYLPQ